MARCSKKFHLPAADVEAAEAVLAEASREPVLEDDSDEEDEGQMQAWDRGQATELRPPEAGSDAARRPGSSTRSTVGSERAVSGGTSPACSSGRSSPRARSESGSERGAATPQLAGPEGHAGSAAARLAAAGPVAVPAGAAAEPAGPASPPIGSRLGSALQRASPGSSRRSSLERESKPSMRAVAANWRAWVAVRDAPCPGERAKPQAVGQGWVACALTALAAVCVS